MKSRVVNQPKLMMELEPHEAKWLMENMQNPLHGQTPGEEDQKDSELRIGFFDACKKVMV